MILLGQAEGGFTLTSLLFPALMILMMYFLLIRPQQQQAKKANEFRNALKAGDRVITAGGLFGTIQKIDERSVELEIAHNVRVTLLRTQVVAHQSNAQAETTDSAAR